MLPQPPGAPSSRMQALQVMAGPQEWAHHGPCSLGPADPRGWVTFVWGLQGAAGTRVDRTAQAALQKLMAHGSWGQEQPGATRIGALCEVLQVGKGPRAPGQHAQALP